MRKSDSKTGNPPPQAPGNTPGASAEVYAALSDAELFHRLAAGDRQAWDMLHHRYWLDVRDFIRSQYAQDEHTAEDIASETFTRLWERQRSLGEPRHVLRYIKSMASSVLIDQRRLRKTNVIAVGELSENHPSPLPSAYALLEQKELAQRIDKAMEVLPESQRAALELAAFDSLSAKEIAAKLGCTPNAARQLVQKARKRLDSEKLLDRK